MREGFPVRGIVLVVRREPPAFARRRLVVGFPGPSRAAGHCASFLSGNLVLRAPRRRECPADEVEQSPIRGTAPRQETSSSTLSKRWRACPDKALDEVFDKGLDKVLSIPWPKRPYRYEPNTSTCHASLLWDQLDRQYLRTAAEQVLGLARTHHRVAGGSGFIGPHD